MGQTAAVFDLDRTLVVGTSIETCFVRQGRRRGLIGPAALWHSLVAGLRALGLLPGRDRTGIEIPPGLSPITRLRYAFFSGNKAYLRGLPLKTCHTVAQETFHEEIQPRLSRRGQGRVRWHQQAGHTVVLLSGTLDFLGVPIQAHLDADHLIAAHPEVRAGRLTGRLRSPHPYGRRKSDLLSQLAAEQDLDLAASYAYGDHHTDAFVLDIVGHPVAVNPDRKLAQVAKDRGWPIERF